MELFEPSKPNKEFVNKKELINETVNYYCVHYSRAVVVLFAWWLLCCWSLITVKKVLFVENVISYCGREEFICVDFKSVSNASANKR